MFFGLHDHDLYLQFLYRMGLKTALWSWHTARLVSEHFINLWGRTFDEVIDADKIWSDKIWSDHIRRSRFPRSHALCLNMFKCFSCVYKMQHSATWYPSPPEAHGISFCRCTNTMKSGRMMNMFFFRNINKSHETLKQILNIWDNISKLFFVYGCTVDSHTLMLRVVAIAFKCNEFYSLSLFPIFVSAVG